MHYALYDALYTMHYTMHYTLYTMSFARKVFLLF